MFLVYTAVVELTELNESEDEKNLLSKNISDLDDEELLRDREKFLQGEDEMNLDSDEDHFRLNDEDIEKKYENLGYAKEGNTVTMNDSDYEEYEREKSQFLVSQSAYSGTGKLNPGSINYDDLEANREGRSSLEQNYGSTMSDSEDTDDLVERNVRDLAYENQAYDEYNVRRRYWK